MSSANETTCPFCGAEIDADALRCPHCGSEWEDVEERETLRAIMKIPGMGEKRTKRLQEAGFKRIKDIEDADLEEILKKTKLPFRIAKEIKETVEKQPELYMCPNCGAFIPADSKVCPICGAEISPEEVLGKEVESRALKDDLFMDENSLYICRVCGAFVSENDEECPVCGAPMPENRAPLAGGREEAERKLENEERNIKAIRGFFGVENIKNEPLPTDDILESNTELDICSNCGAFVRPEAEVCPVCGASLIPEIPREEEKKVENEALDALEDLKNQLIGADIEAPVPETERVEYVCPNCGSPVEPDAEVCPVCGARFEKENEEFAEEGKVPQPEESTVLSLEDALSEKPRAEAVKEDEIKTEVDSLIMPSRKEKAEVSGNEAKEELARVLEGGLDKVSSIKVEKKKRTVKRRIPEEKHESRDWRRMEDIGMAASAIAAAFLSSEYLLTYTVVRNPRMAYGIGALSVFIPLLIIAAFFIVLDRKRVFASPASSLLLLLPIAFSLVVPLHWYLRQGFGDAFLCEIILLSLYFAGTLAVTYILRDTAEPLILWFSGIVQIAVHSLLFTAASSPWTAAGDVVPSYALAVSGGITMSLGIYLRIDSGVRALLAARDVVVGHRYYLGGDYGEAMKYYTRAINRRHSNEPGYDLAYYSKGTALLSAGNNVEALRYLNRAVKENPNNEMAWNNRGIAMSKLGLNAGAMKCYDKALSINQDYEVAWNNKGNALARMGKYEEALECYDRALGLNPDYNDAWVNKGYILIKLGRYEEARKCADHILQPKKPSKAGSRAPVGTEGA